MYSIKSCIPDSDKNLNVDSMSIPNPHQNRFLDKERPHLVCQYPDLGKLWFQTEKEIETSLRY